ncbi:hypothetical protein HMPREF0658_1070 [Hoylesella marshii DSM 16973 = JCM 13450]|uniref:Uncharacterized protein n=1 Tax=Hoylesella marshii DSM 16973 = JCM 13450 TaxID=862515 RepID=E0NSB9_9BACT|nr:hypothetical protein HMPREF0658_1070 [Hoylesella marshii DSM 16973 = JCM 13450]
MKIALLNFNPLADESIKAPIAETWLPGLVMKKKKSSAINRRH